MGESRVAWRPLILLVLASSSVCGAPGNAPADWRSADDIGSPRGLSTGNRAVDMLLQQQLEQAAMSASAVPSKTPSAHELLAAKQQITDDAKSTRDALLREAAMLAEQQKTAQAPRPGEGNEPDAVQGRASHRGADMSSGSDAPAALQGWRATVKELAQALRENREWIIGVALLVGAGVLWVRTLGALRASRRGAPGRFQTGRR